MDKTPLPALKGKKVTHPSYPRQVGEVIEAFITPSVYVGELAVAVVRWKPSGEVDRVRADLLEVQP